MITERCIDNNPHFCIIWYESESDGTLVFCQKCLKVFKLAQPEPPQPEPPGEGDSIIFRATLGDDTAALQAILDNLSKDLVIEGFAGINSNGLSLRSVGGRKISGAGVSGGGFRALSDGPYSTPYSSMFFGEHLDACIFENLKFDCNAKNVQGIFLNLTTNCLITGCEVWNIRHISGVGIPYAGIKVDASTDIEIAYNYVHDTTGADGDSGVRGIWAGVGNQFCTRPHIHHNKVERTGHTAIVTESEAPRVHDNAVRDALTQGTGYKFIPRGGSAEAFLDFNIAENTVGSALMIEGSESVPVHIWVRNWTASNIGKDGTTFGFLYVSGQPLRNISVADCQLVNCKRTCNLNNVSAAFFTGLRLSGTGAAALENNVHNVTFQNAGTVEIGRNVSDIWVDGKKVA